jgi:glycosyltransferase involved in cell wall biosynthesis
VHTFLRHARLLIMPSTWYESFGMVLIEAYAHGVPVLATRIGAIENIVRDGETGALFQLNSSADLSAKLTALEHDPALLVSLSHAARREYEQHYSATIIAEQLRTIYNRARSSGQVVRAT